jgi:putative heme-binding domain-containing protein
VIKPNAPTAVQIAAVHTLSAIPNTTVSQYVIKNWSKLSSSVRNTAINTFLVRPFRPERIELLLGAIKDGIVKPEELTWTQKVPLMRDIPDTLKKEAIALLKRKKNKKSVKQYIHAVTKKTGRSKKGRMVFIQNCAVCHQIGEASGGSDFGPNLATVSGWDKSRIITNVVLPNKSIAKGYSVQLIKLKDGKVRQEVISNRTSNAITVRDVQGSETTIDRSRIKSIKSRHTSPMPTDFKEKITPQEMADLVVFIKNTK